MNDIRTFFRKPHIKLNSATGEWTLKVFTKHGKPALANIAVWYVYNQLWCVPTTKAFVARLNENKGDLKWAEKQ